MTPRLNTVDDYLEALYFLAFPVGEYGPMVTGRRPAPAARVAEMLGVSAPTASEMLKRLEAEGLISRDGRRPLLTAAGRERAERVVRHHRIVERFLTDMMGYTAAESHQHADQLGGAFTEEMVERLDQLLGHPERCPHGWPVDPAVEQAENRNLIALANAGDGDRVEVVRLAEHDDDLLNGYYAQGLTPGCQLSVTATGDQFIVRSDEAEHTLDVSAARGLYVRVLTPG